MSKLYVFAIGGSGSRVLRSLTMLLSSGVHTNYEIVPMIVDPDQSNGDLVRTVDVMRSYENIHNALSFNNNEKNEFFKNPISALNDDGNYLLPLVGTSGISFENYLSLGTMSLENQAIMRMLFSNANLASDMNVGLRAILILVVLYLTSLPTQKTTILSLLILLMATRCLLSVRYLEGQVQVASLFC